MTIAPRDRRRDPHTPGPHASATGRHPARPVCSLCRTDAYLSYDSFIPPFYSAESKGLSPSVVSYTCHNCGGHYSLNPPEGWTPPGWQWYD